MKNAAILIIGLIYAVSSVSAEDTELEKKAKLGIQLDAGILHITMGRAAPIST